MENIQDSVSEYTKDSAQKIDTDALYHEQMLKALYAGFGIRFCAFIIDLLIIFGVHSLILKPIYHFTNLDSAKLWIDYFSVGHLLDALVFYLYFVLMTKYFKQTLGKMICNIRVERMDRQQLTWTDVLFREWIGRIISGVFANLPYLMTIFTKKHRGIHDYFADTVVIKNKFEKLFYLK
ncbi:RDD family protein [Staphylococcus saprophyticus]|uniref:RDD family protein n=1 Tax=Staphylococcus saprophyticus TaxID=29385 RepID=UPI000852DA5D|nr:RDD family protein [Staphylococcus saprophyticus]ASE59149.1 RDD family protein [Staphylococcus saprophyticus]MCM3119081.1 RDD family protein [Staphylococcus saprophyticus]MDW3879763.1 RDD family protein [Staphylococcus saprophyticus]MDW3918570.1 RDD family protein [Staphylococcus saprophyticus]MDW3922149.1 RDD family protein [Staphylococcus saprophyticus]